MKQTEPGLDLSTQTSKVVTILHHKAPSNKQLVSFKLACIDDLEMVKEFDTHKGNKVKMEIANEAQAFFADPARTCIGRLQPSTATFTDTLFLEVNVADPTDDNLIGFVISPLLLISHVMIIYW